MKDGSLSYKTNAEFIASGMLESISPFWFLCKKFRKSIPAYFFKSQAQGLN